MDIQYKTDLLTLSLQTSEHAKLEAPENESLIPVNLSLVGHIDPSILYTLGTLSEKVVPPLLMAVFNQLQDIRESKANFHETEDNFTENADDDKNPDCDFDEDFEDRPNVIESLKEVLFEAAQLFTKEQLLAFIDQSYTAQKPAHSPLDEGGEKLVFGSIRLVELSAEEKLVLQRWEKQLGELTPLSFIDWTRFKAEAHGRFVHTECPRCSSNQSITLNPDGSASPCAQCKFVAGLPCNERAGLPAEPWAPGYQGIAAPELQSTDPDCLPGEDGAENPDTEEKAESESDLFAEERVI